MTDRISRPRIECQELDDNRPVSTRITDPNIRAMVEALEAEARRPDLTTPEPSAKPIS